MKENDSSKTNPLESLLCRKIEEGGPISFSVFMQDALYHREWGYYENCNLDQVGKEGDFITSVSVGETFGKLLALKLKSIAEKHPEFENPVIVEAGSHNAQLASDIIKALCTLGCAKLFQNYTIIEPSETRKIAQKEKLKDLPIDIRWIESIEKLNSDNPIFFLSNELFDAFPVQRLYWDRSQEIWKEWLVTRSNGQFSWIKSETVIRDLPQIINDRLGIENDLGRHIPDGFSIEVSPTSVSYYQSLLSKINTGWIITIDYGQIGESWIQPHKINGTLRGYKNHKWVEDELANPGYSDLTCDVCFQDLELTGQHLGFQTIFCGDQSSFLTHILRENQDVISQESAFWSQKENRQFLTLVSPQFFGSRFKVLEQSLFG